MRFLSLLLVTITSLGMTRQSEIDPQVIEKAAATNATVGSDGVVRIGWARDEVPVTVDGMPLKPPAGLGSWAAFTSGPDGAVVMGDTVVFQDEVDAAMDTALAGGLAITALHNHFFFDEPKVYFMHIGGHGDLEKLASVVRKVWDAIKEVRSEKPRPATSFPGHIPTSGSIDSVAIEKILGLKTSVVAGVVKVSKGREGLMHGIPVGESMGLNTWAAFSGSDDYAAVDGDFIMTAREVQPVIKALRKAGIHIVALHNHMIGDEPYFYFLHYWGKGPATDLAEAIRAALQAQEDTNPDGNY